jgi:hypothetical protein
VPVNSMGVATSRATSHRICSRAPTGTTRQNLPVRSDLTSTVAPGMIAAPLAKEMEKAANWRGGREGVVVGGGGTYNRTPGDPACEMQSVLVQQPTCSVTSPRCMPEHSIKAASLATRQGPPRTRL